MGAGDLKLYQSGRPRPQRAVLPIVDAGELFAVINRRIDSARARQRVSLAYATVALLLAGAVRQTSDGRWLVTLSAKEIARLAGLSERHAQRARQGLIAADVFRLVATVLPAGTLVLELPRDRFNQEAHTR